MANRCRTLLLTALFLLPVMSPQLRAQDKDAKASDKDKPAEPTPPTPPTPKEESSATDHTLKIGAPKNDPLRRIYIRKNIEKKTV